MFDHVDVRVRDLERSRAFYATVLAPLGLEASEGPEMVEFGALTLVPGAPATGQFAAVSSNYLERRIAELKRGPGGLLVGWKDQHACHGRMLKIANRVLVSHGAPGAHHHG